MRARESLREAVIRTKGEPSRPGQTRVSAFLGNLQDTSREITPPPFARPAQDMAFAVLNRTASPDLRVLHANRAVNTVKDTLFSSIPTIGTLDLAEVTSRAREISQRVVEGTVRVASDFPQMTRVQGLGHELLDIFKPEQPSFEDRAVAACVIFDIFQPYLIDRLLELDIYSPEELRRQYQQMRRDTELVKHFYHSTGPSIQFAAEGQMSLPMDEVAERLFGLGPITAKMVQGLNVSEKRARTDKAKWVAQMAQAFQEGLAPPTQSQLTVIKKELPEGLSYVDTISSASVAHVLAVKTPEGEDLVTKVKRPGIAQAIDDDVAMHTLLSNILIRYAEEHTKDTALTSVLQNVKKAIPFLIEVTARDLRAELDFSAEATHQRNAVEIFKRLPGIFVPRVMDKYSDPDHITMERIDGVPIEALPAHPDHLKNIMVLLLKLWKERSVLGLHGDMHDRNVKGKGDGKGSVVVYDWANIVKPTDEFMKNMRHFLFAVVRKNPRAIGKTYSRIQDQRDYQATEEEIGMVAEEVFASLSRDHPTVEQKGMRKKLKAEAKKTSLIIPVFVTAMAARHQGTIDTDYRRFLETAIRIANVTGKELAKPEYKDPKYRRKVLRKSFVAAVKEVYFPKPEEKQGA